MPRNQDGNSVVLQVISLDLASNDIASAMMEQLRTCMNALQQESLHVIDMHLEQEKEYFDKASFMSSERGLEGLHMLEALSPETVNNLQVTIKLMVNSGFDKECLIVYSSCRREFLEEGLVKQLFSSDNLTIEDVNMKDLKLCTERWIKAFKVALKKMFPTERQLYNIVFFEFSDISDLSFMDVCREFTIRLLNFPNVVANDQSHPKLLFKMLNMYETLHDLIPNFQSLFCDQYSVSLRNELNTVLMKLGETIVGTFMKLENVIRCQALGNEPVLGGRLQPLVPSIMNYLSFIMNYLSRICDYRETLEQVFEDHAHMLLEYTKYDDIMPSSSSLSLQMELIVEVLESIFEAMSIIRDMIESKEIVVEKVASEENPADVFTKSLPRSRFKHCLDLIKFVEE